jgi:hypothetical protein
VPCAGDDNIEFIGRGRLRHKTEGRKRKRRERCRAFREISTCYFAHKILPFRWSASTVVPPQCQETGPMAP